MALKAVAAPLGAPVGGTGAIDTIPRWIGASTLGDSGLIDNGTSIYTSTRRVGVDTSTTLANVKLQVGTAASLANYQGAPLGVVLPAGSGSWLELAENSASGTSFRISKDSSTGVVLNTNGKTIGFTAAGYTTAISSSQVVLTTTGNVGIGTASPASVLHVRNNTAGITLDSTLGGGRQYQLNPLRTGLSNSGFEIRDVTAGAAVISIDASQQVGIGTASPASRLDVAGTITCDDAGTGLKLPATPGNADTQTLDAYQEIGTGTPAEIALTLTCGTSGTITVNAASSKARVTRVGNKVIGHGRIVVSSVSAPLGRLSCVLTGCPQPFTNFLVETQTDNTTGLASGNRIVGTSDTAATPTIYFDRYSPNTSSTDAAANIQAGTIIVFNICYSV
jgi:hypothetical protein